MLATSTGCCHFARGRKHAPTDGKRELRDYRQTRKERIRFGTGFKVTPDPSERMTGPGKRLVITLENGKYM